jgi:CheY-like chemotaxis protein
MEAVGQLTGGIAHDFNNLLTVVIGSLDMARRRATSLEPRVAALIDHALEGANRAARLTTRLLAFSRRQPLSPEPTNVNRLVSGMSELLGRTLGEQNRIETVLAADIWATMVDPNQLENALVNLAVNARDAMPGGGRLTIETANIQLDDADAESETGIEPGEYVLLSVTDTGTGMSRDVLDKVFDPFFTTKEVGKGTGLGLSMVYGFVKQSRGHVRIHSEPGHGTGIKLFLPRWFGAAGAAAPAGREAGRAVLPVILGQANVLVVEDDPDVRVLSVRMLTDLGHHVREAASPTQALEVLKGEERIDLLFTDIVMPDLDGRRLADLALTLRPDLKVLFTTGYTRDVLVEADLGEPFVSLLPKPFTLQQLASKLQEILL